MSITNCSECGLAIDLDVEEIWNFQGEEMCEPCFIEADEKFMTGQGI